MDEGARMISRISAEAALKQEKGSESRNCSIRIVMQIHSPTSHSRDGRWACRAQASLNLEVGQVRAHQADGGPMPIVVILVIDI